MTGIDLELLGDRVTAADTRRAEALRERRAAYGNLEDLSCWWAGVHGPDRPSTSGEIRPLEVLGVGLTPGTADTVLPAGIVLTHAFVDLPDGPVRPTDPFGTDEALAAGIALADGFADRGGDLIALAVPVGTPALVLATFLLGCDPVEARGWPHERGIDDGLWQEEVLALRDGLWTVRGLHGRPVDLLRALGCPQLALATALLLQAALRRTPVLLDGPGAAAAALLAADQSDDAAGWWWAPHRGPDPLHAKALQSLRLTPPLDLGLDVEDGTAVRLGLHLLQQTRATLPESEQPEPAGAPEPEQPVEQVGPRCGTGEPGRSESALSEPEPTEPEPTEAEPVEPEPREHEPPLSEQSCGPAPGSLSETGTGTGGEDVGTSGDVAGAGGDDTTIRKDSPHA